MSKGIIQETRTVDLPDGRVLGYAEYGDPDGLCVIGLHGVPGARFMFRPFARFALKHGLRIVAPDRPGFGLSPPKPDRVLGDWIDDAAQLIRHLGVNRFSIIGISGGTPFAVSMAAHFGERVAVLALVGPIGPVAELGDAVDMSFLQRGMFLRFPNRPRVFKWTTAGANALFRLAPEANYALFIRALAPSDREILKKPEIKAHVIEDVHESLKWNGDGARDDMKIFSKPWNVDYGRITARSVLWQGLDDTVVPVEAALALGRMIPGCRIIELQEEGHFWMYRETEEIVSTVADMARK